MVQKKKRSGDLQKVETDALNEVKEKVSQGCLTRTWICCCLVLDLCLDSPSRKFGKECIADGELLSKMFFI